MKPLLVVVLLALTCAFACAHEKPAKSRVEIEKSTTTTIIEPAPAVIK